MSVQQSDPHYGKGRKIINICKKPCTGFSLTILQYDLTNIITDAVTNSLYVNMDITMLDNHA